MVYLQMLTRDEISKLFKDYEIVRFNKHTRLIVKISQVPDVAFYEVFEGLKQIELLD